MGQAVPEEARPGSFSLRLLAKCPNSTWAWPGPRGGIREGSLEEARADLEPLPAPHLLGPSFLQEKGHLRERAALASP